VLIDVKERRTAFLLDAAHDLGLGERVEVVTAPAERAARDPRWRHACDLVVARSFGPTAVVAECGAGFLRRGGWLLVSEPPVSEPDRWPASGLRRFGLRDAGRVEPVPGVHLRRLRQVEPTGAGVPRREGLPARQPAW